ncbi:MAG: hypothetical protein ACREKJ_08295, partial [Candidatus Rokuibacteriota bacterium]
DAVDGATRRRGEASARPPRGAAGNFLLAFVGAAATMNQKFTTSGGGAPLEEHDSAVSQTRRGESECASHQ